MNDILWSGVLLFVTGLGSITFILYSTEWSTEQIDVPRRLEVILYCALDVVQEMVSEYFHHSDNNSVKGFYSQ